jgi:hypothetical protein
MLKLDKVGHDFRSLANLGHDSTKDHGRPVTW